ncbi:MAG: response regulator [Candidatus Rokubacteria bacterium]|nr:response regulator [Candidatus Rokubacteria bacterium]
MTAVPAPLFAVAPAPSGDVLRVLVVDDNASVLRFLAAAFGANACLVSQASTAEQALELLRGERFDLVVSDIKMPGLSGLDLLRAVKGRQPGTPVVLITGAPSVSSAVFGLRYGAYDYLPKPFSVKEIQELLHRLRCDQREGRSQAFPAGLTEELDRRQFGVEVLFRIGELALGGIDPSTFIETVLGYTMQSLRADGALIILREEDGTFKATRRGQPVLLGELSSALQGAFESLLATGGREARPLAAGPGLAAIAALVPGLGNSMGVLCLARDAKVGAFLPDEQELLLGYARTTAVALQKILLRESLEQNLVDTIAAFVNAIESKDVYLKGHSARVSLYSGEIGTVMGMSEADVLVLGRAGMLHDLGKLVMLDSILRKPGKLTPEEYGLIQMHPGVGDRILQPLKFLVPESRAVRHHHERYDGRGYPDGLRGEEIPPLARVVTVADAFDAMTSDRPYRGAMPLAAAREELLRVSGTQVDPTVVAAFAAIPISRLDEVSARYHERRGTVDNPAPLGETVVCAQAEAVVTA